MRMIVALVAVTLAGVVLAACAGATAERASVAQPAAAAVTLGPLTISAAWVRPADPAAQPISAAYLTIANGGERADALIGVSAGDLAQAVELHTVTEDGGMMRMRPVDTIELPAGGEVALAPGGLHIMLIGVSRELAPGDTVRLLLTFREAGTVELDAVVRPAQG